MSTDGKDQPVTNSDVEEIVGRVVSEAMKQIAARFDKVDERFNKVDKRFNEVDKRLDKVDGQLDEQHKGIADLHEELVEVHDDIVEVQIIAERTERKVDVHIQRVDDHSITLGELKRRAA